MIECLLRLLDHGPWTYLAFANLRQLAASSPGTWRSACGGRSWSAGFSTPSIPAIYAQRADPVPAKARYMLKDLADWRAHGLAIKFPPRKSSGAVNSVKVMRLIIARPALRAT